MINVSHEEGMLESEEKEMIHNVFEFRESRVTEVMTPRTYMVAVSLDSSYDKNSRSIQNATVFASSRI